MNENTYDISSKQLVTSKNFLEFSRFSHAKQQRNVQKKVCSMCKVALSLIRPIVAFHRSPSPPSPLSITRFYILFAQNFILSRASLLALAKSIYYVFKKRYDWIIFFQVLRFKSSYCKIHKLAIILTFRHTLRSCTKTK